jgi:carboxylesterase
MRNLAFLFVLTIISCGGNPVIPSGELDSGELVEQSLLNPERFLVSRQFPNPTAYQKTKTVIVAAHGFSATTFEWDEFRTWLKDTERDTTILLSQVLLGGHGRSYKDFKASSWSDWQASIIAEYTALENLGFQNIVLVGSSTGCALITEMFGSGFFRNRLAPKRVAFVDPIVLPSDKLLSVVKVAGPILGFVESDMDAGEERYWYRFRPQETLQELNKLLLRIRKQLEKGINAGDTSFQVFKSTSDPSADPVSAVLLYRGIRTNSGKITVHMVDSDLHVYTRLALRNNVTGKQRTQQVNTFDAIATGRLLQP